MKPHLEGDAPWSRLHVRRRPPMEEQKGNHIIFRDFSRGKKKKSRCCICTASCWEYCTQWGLAAPLHQHCSHRISNITCRSIGVLLHLKLCKHKLITSTVVCFLLMSNVSWLAVKNITSDISYYLKTRFFVGVALSFSWKLELFLTMREFDLMYRMCIKTIREEWGNCT